MNALAMELLAAAVDTAHLSPCRIVAAIWMNCREKTPGFERLDFMEHLGTVLLIHCEVLLGDRDTYWDDPGTCAKIINEFFHARLAEP